MRITTLVLVWIARAAGVLQIVLGILFWSGRALTYVPVHVINGMVVVLALWALAAIALGSGTRRATALLALACGLALPAFGMRQGLILVGPMHWMVRVLHLLMGGAAIELANVLARAIAPSTEPREVRPRAASNAGSSTARAR